MVWVVPVTGNSLKRRRKIQVGRFEQHSTPSTRQNKITCIYKLDLCMFYVVMLKSQVGLLQTAHYWTNAGVLLGVRMRRGVESETIKERLPSGHMLPWHAWRMANRVRSGQVATPAAKHLWGYRESKNCMCNAATCDLNHIMMSYTHCEEKPSKDDVGKMKDRSVRWLSAVADTT